MQPSIPDPHHYSGPANGRWTTRNIGEAVPGVPTPLSWSLWGEATNRAALGVFSSLGAFSRAEELDIAERDLRTVALFHGRPAANLHVFSTAAGRLGRNPADVERSYFGIEPGPDTPRRELRRVPLVLVRAPAAARRYRAHLRHEAAVSEAYWRGHVDRALAPDEARVVLRVAARRFIAFMEAHTFQALLCSGVFDALAKLAAQHGLPGLEMRLTGADASLEEVRVASDLWAASRGELTVEAFLRRHGFHGPDVGELASHSWREEPGPLYAAVRSHASQSDDRSPLAALRRRQADRAEAACELLGACSPILRPVARRLLGWVAAEEIRRELGKTTFLRTLDVARHAARSVGADLARAGTLDDPDDVFMLTLEEIADQRDEDRRSMVAERRALMADRLAFDLPVLSRGDPVPVPRRDRSPNGGVGTLTAVAASPGVVEGRARVCATSADCAEPVGPDEVLVTHTTDPSWVAFFMTAGGLVVDVGGPLSHAAIIARSLGIPCVINTEDGTHRIPDGACVRVDGAAGTVEILSLATEGA
jgi:pyruvate,water dikinase